MLISTGKNVKKGNKRHTCSKRFSWKQYLLAEKTSQNYHSIFTRMSYSSTLSVSDCSIHKWTPTTNPQKSEQRFMHESFLRFMHESFLRFKGFWWKFIQIVLLRSKCCLKIGFTTNSCSAEYFPVYDPTIRVSLCFAFELFGTSDDLFDTQTTFSFTGVFQHDRT